MFIEFYKNKILVCLIFNFEKFNSKKLNFGYWILKKLYFGKLVEKIEFLNIKFWKTDCQKIILILENWILQNYISQNWISRFIL